MAEVSREELLHIAELADLNLKEEDIDNHLMHLQDILNFANVVNNVNVEGLDITIGANESKNVFREDKVVEFGDIEALLQNAPDKERNMFNIPKVIE